MACGDHKPLLDTPATARILAHAPNRLGAVYSALYCFWSARHSAVTANQERLTARFGIDVFYSALHNLWSGRPANTTGTLARRDAFSVVLFDHSTKNTVVNDSTNSPNRLLGALLTEYAEGGTNFASALRAGEAVMVENWSPERLVAPNPLLTVWLLSDPLNLGHQSWFSSPMGNAQCPSRKSKTFVARRFDMGELLSACADSSLTAYYVGNRYLFMRYPLAENPQVIVSVGWRSSLWKYKKMGFVLLLSCFPLFLRLSPPLRTRLVFRLLP
jgi:hypothetical protein